MSTQVSTESYLQAKVNILEEDVRHKNDKLSLLEAYVKQLTDVGKDVTSEDSNEDN